MFFCNNCAKERGWPASLYKSYGKCEACGNIDSCNDTPSSQLPPSKEELDHYTKQDEASREHE